MTHFLHHLALRGLGRSDALRPRPASLFEPPAAIALLAGRLADNTSEDETPSDELDVVPPRVHSTPLTRQPEPPAPLVPHPVDTPSVRPVANMRAATTEPRSAAEPHKPQPAVPAATQPSVLVPVLPPTLQPAVSLVPITPPPVSSHIPERPAPDTEPAAIAQRVTPAKTPAKAMRTTEVERHTIVHTVERVVAPNKEREPTPEPAPQSPAPRAPAAAPVRATLAPQPVPRREQQPAPRELSAPVHEPVIQVSIGRIEVRATQAPAAARQRSEPTVMSLDEYLRRRAGGER